MCGYFKNIFRKNPYASEYDQEMPQSQTKDQVMAPWEGVTEHSTVTRQQEYNSSKATSSIQLRKTQVEPWWAQPKTYSKTCVKWPLKNRQNKDLNDKW